MTKKKEYSSILNLDYRIVSVVPFATLLLYRFFSSFIFMLQVFTMDNLKLDEQIYIYIGTVIGVIDIICFIISMCIYLFEKEMKLVKYNMFLYGFINIMIPICLFIIGFIIGSPIITLLILAFYLMIETLFNIYVIYNIAKNRVVKIIGISDIVLKKLNIEI